MVKLPKTGIWKQNNRSDRFDDLEASFNLDLSTNYGATRISPRMLLNINTDDDAQLSAPPCAFKAFTCSGSDDVGASTMYLWAIAKNHMWNSRGGPNTTFKQDATLNTPTSLNSDQSDLSVAYTKMYVTQASRDVKYIDSSGVWGTIVNGLADSSGLHQMTFFRALKKTYIVDDNGAGISSIENTTPTNVAASTQYTLNDLVEGSGVALGSQISCIASNTSRIGIGTINSSGSTCKFYTWDGSLGGGGTYGPNEEYNLDASGVLSVIVVDDTFVIFDTKGRLMQLNGGTFVELDRLPINGQLKLPLTPTSRPVHYNGMSLVDGNIEILINTQLWDTNSTIKTGCPSGIWCYDRESRTFYHKRSMGLTKSGGTITDYGASKLSLVGALASVEIINATPTQGSINGTILAGCDYYTTATVTKSGIFYDDTNDTLQKTGILITSKIFSDNVSDTWQKAYLRFRKFLSSTDKIIVKYRTNEDEATEATITYTSTTTLTVPTASFTTAPLVGYEIEIIQGVGAGRTAHITAITTNGSNYEITIDETITGATTQTAKAKFQDWTKIDTFNSQTEDVFKLPVDKGNTSIFVQFKVWFLWTGKNQLYDLIVSSKVNEAIE